MQQYSKFIIAALWAIVQFVLLAFGVDLTQWVTDTITVLVALGVLVVPNTSR